MRNGRGIVEEEWTVLVLPQKTSRRLVDYIRRIFDTRKTRVTFRPRWVHARRKFLVRAKRPVRQRHALMVVPQTRRVIVMGDRLIIVAKELINSLRIGITCASDCAQPPLPESARNVAEL